MKHAQDIVNEVASILFDDQWTTEQVESIPERVSALLEERHRLIAGVRVKEQAIAHLTTYINTKPDTDNPNKDAAYVRMVETCVKAGLTPLTPDEFAKEDKRLLVDWNRRRHGIKDELPTARPFQTPCVVYYKRMPWWKRLLRRALGVD